MINLVTWTMFSIFYLLYVNILDTCILVNILCLDNSVVFDQGEDEKSKIQKHKYFVYRDIIRSMKQLNSISENTSFLFHKRQNLQRLVTQQMTISEKIAHQENEMKVDDLYIIRKECIIAAYEQVSS